MSTMTRVKNQEYQRTTALGPHIRDYLRWFEVEWGARPRSLDTYEGVLYRVALKKPQLDPKKWTVDDVRDVIYDAPNRSRPNWTSIISAFWKWMETEERIPVAPTRRLRSPRQRKTLKDSIFTPTEQAALEGLPDLRDRALMTLLFNTGLRMNEASHLRMGEIRMDKNIVLVLEGKGGKDRKIGIPDEICELMADLALVEGINAPDYLWYGFTRGSHKVGEQRGVTRSAPINDDRFYRWWYGCLDKARVKYKRAKDGTGFSNPHQARHTFASSWLVAGRNVGILSKMLGHESIAVTVDIYGHFMTDDMLSEVRLFADQRKLTHSGVHETPGNEA